MFAHGIDFVNRRAAIEQNLGGPYLVFEGYFVDRTRQERRPAAGYEKDYEIVFGCFFQEASDPFGTFNSRLVRHRMARFDELDHAGRKRMAIFDDDGTVQDLIAKNFFNGSCHARAGLSRSHDVDITIRSKVVWLACNIKRISLADNVAVDGVKGVCGGKTGIKYPASVSAKLGQREHDAPYKLWGAR